MMDPRAEYWNVPLMRGDKVAERPADQRTITRRYTEEALRFIRENASRPFFLYLAHTHAARAALRLAGVRGQEPRAAATAT